MDFLTRICIMSLSNIEVTNHFIIDSRLKCAILREIRSRSF